MKRIVLANQKGGVSKTTTALNLAAGLAAAGKRTLAIDMDPQANLTFAAMGQNEPDLSSYDLLKGEYSVRDVLIHVAQLGIDLIPSHIDLAGVEIEFANRIGGQIRLRTKLRSAPPYDYIIIDAPPSLGLLTINSLAAADEVLIPVSASVFALKGIARLEETIEDIRINLDHPNLKIIGVLATMVDHTNISNDVVAAIRERFGVLTFTTAIPKNVKVEEAHSRAESVLSYAPASQGAIAYRELVQEVLSRE